MDWHYYDDFQKYFIFMKKHKLNLFFCQPWCLAMVNSTTQCLIKVLLFTLILLQSKLYPIHETDPHFS